MQNLVNIHVAQMILTESFVNRNSSGLLTVKKRQEINRQINSTLTYARKYGSQLLIFPELSLPDDTQLRKRLQKHSEQHNCVIVAGSYYKKIKGGGKRQSGERYAPTCPVFVNGELFEAGKFTCSPIEESVHSKVTLETSDKLFYLENTPAGNIAVAICSDILDPELVALVHQQRGIDILCVPSLQKKPETHYKTLSELVRKYQDGMFIAYSNILWRGYSGGGSSVFGRLDKVFTNQLSYCEMSDRADDSDEHIIRMPDCGRNLIVSANLQSKKPVLGKTVKDTSPLKLIFGDYHFLTERSMFVPMDRRRKNTRIRIVAFDFDGTLVQDLKFSWELIWTNLYGEKGTELRRALKDKYQTATRNSPEDRIRHYKLWCDECCKQFMEKGLTREKVVSFFQGYSPVSGLLNAIQYLKHKLKCKVILVSGGLDIVARSILGEEIWNEFDDKYINGMSFSATGDEKLTHIEPTLFDFEGKYEAIASSALKIGCLPPQTAFVGDEVNDKATLWQIHSEGGLSIAFGLDSAISAEEVTLVIKSDNISEVVQAIEARNTTSQPRNIPHIKRLRNRYSENGNELAKLFVEAKQIFTSWVSQLEKEVKHKSIGPLSFVNHDGLHRKRVLNIVSQLIDPARYRSENSSHLSFLADCAVTLHDIGLLLPPEMLVPGASSYDDEIRSLYLQSNHHEVAGLSLDQISKGIYHSNFINLLKESQLYDGVDSPLELILKETCAILSEITRFHDAEKNEAFGAHQDLVDAIESASYLSVTVQDITYLRAVLRLGDRLDRHHGRLVDSKNVNELCKQWMERAVDQATVSGVVQDCVVIKSCEAHCSEFGYLSVRYKPVTIQDRELNEFVKALFNDRIIKRHQNPKAWYMREIEKHVVIRVSDPILSSETISSDHQQNQLVVNNEKKADTPITNVMRDILRCCPQHSWIQIVAAERYLNGGLEGPFNTKKIIPVGQIFDCYAWGLENIAKPVAMQTSEMINSFASSGGSLKRLIGLRVPEKPEWDIYIPFIDPSSHDCVALLNAHLFQGNSRTQAEADNYKDMLEKYISPYSNRLIRLISEQVHGSFHHLDELGFNEQVTQIQNYRKGDKLEEFDLCQVFEEICFEKGQQWKCKLDKVSTIYSEKPLFEKYSSILSVVSSVKLFQTVVELLGDAISSLGEYSVSLIEEKKLPYNSILLESRQQTEESHALRSFQQLIELTHSAEIEAVSLRDQSEVQAKLSAAYEMAKLGGISVTAKSTSTEKGMRVYIAISVLPKMSLYTR